MAVSETIWPYVLEVNFKITTNEDVFELVYLQILSINLHKL